MFICKEMPQSVSAEAYKSIRTSLKYTSVDKKLKSIVITSSVPGEGKSTVAGNLAICLAESGSNVLIVDCDLRRPTIHRKFGVSNVNGLTDVLVDPTILKDALKKYSPRITILPAGTIPPNPSEILGSNTFDRLVKELCEKYDYVIIDTPPVLAVTDSKVIAAKTDATLLVVRYGKTKEKVIVRAYDDLRKVGSNIVGTVLNNCDRKHKDNYYSYYGQKRGLFHKSVNKLKG